MSLLDQLNVEPEENMIEDSIQEEVSAPKQEAKAEKPVVKKRRRLSPTEGNVVNTADEERRRDLIDLNESQKVKKALSGVVQSITYKDTGSNLMGIFLVLYHGTSGIPVKIPVEEFLMKIPVEDQPRYPGATEMMTPYQYADRRAKAYIGANIDFIVKDIIQVDGETVVFASRKEAMNEKAKHWYFGKNKSEHIYVDDEVLAIVLAVNQNKVTVEVAGVEAEITPEDFTYQFIYDLRQIATIGETFYVRIKEIDADPENKVVNKLVVSKKEADGDDRLRRMKRFHKNDLCYGYVAYISDNGIIVSFYNESPYSSNKGLPDAKSWIMDCWCNFPSYFERPVVGDKVLVRINNVDENKRMLFGHINVKRVH